MLTIRVYRELGGWSKIIQRNPSPCVHIPSGCLYTVLLPIGSRETLDSDLPAAIGWM
jgi:hypothetical protein